MSEINIYNLKGDVIGEISAPKKLEGLWNPDLVHQVVTGILANKRRSIAHTKTRGEVRGGGVKPWKQKGTGRARHGSIRSPLWIGGGVTFGPRSDKNYSVKINKKMRDAAFLSALSQKIADGEVRLFDSLELTTPKTKAIAGAMNKVVKTGTTVFLIPKDNKNIKLACRNLARFKIVGTESANAYDLVSAKNVLMDKITFDEYAK